MTTRRAFLAGLAGAGAASGLFGEALAARGAAAVAAEFAPPGRYGFILMDADSGAVMEASNHDALFIPASLAKIPTSYAAMKMHGPDARFPTRLLIDGAVEGGTLQGDVHLVGGGDPSLDTAELATLVSGLRSAGIYTIAGRFIFYDAALPNSEWLDRTQPWQAPYNPSMGGLNLNFNRVQFRWSRIGGVLRVGGAAVSDERTAAAPTVKFRITNNGQDISHEKRSDGETWRLDHSGLHGDGRRWLPVRLPGMFTAGVFKALCGEAGISLPDPVPASGAPRGREIGQHLSKPVYSMLQGMLRYSTNLTAEALGASAAYREGERPGSIRGASGKTARMVAEDVGAIGGSGWSGFGLANHSGLSVLSRASPRQIASVLRAGRRDFGESYVSLYNDSRLSARRMGLARGSAVPWHSILAKTGTMHFVRGFAGYIQAGSRNAVFAFMASDDARRAAIDAAFTPYADYKPPDGRRWLRQARRFENAMLADWVLRFSQ